MFESNSEIDFDEMFDDPPKACQLEVKRTVGNENEFEDAKNPCVMESQSVVKLNSLLKKLHGESSSSDVSQQHIDSLRKVVLRKFPGPAGLLPERTTDMTIKNLENLETVKEKQENGGTDMLCSQMSMDVFREGPWIEMKKDFFTHSNHLFEKYDITWIKSNAKADKLMNRKAPFLAAIIQNIKRPKSKISINMMLLKDSTDSIRATIMMDLCEEHVDVLKVGSVIILKEFGVVTSHDGKKHLITITSNNLVKIYSRDKSCDHEIKTTTLQHSSLDYLKKDVKRVKLLNDIESTQNDTHLPSFVRHPNLSNVVENKDKKLDRNNLSTNTFGYTNHMSSNFNCTLNNTVINNNNSVVKASSVEKPRFTFKRRCDTSGNNNVAILGSTEQTESKTSVVICSSTSSGGDGLENSILEDIFEGLDTDLFFDDF